MTGKIIKGIAGFYYVYVEETKEAKETATGGTLYECKAKGTFRKQKIKPLVGDIVDIAVLDDEKHIGNVERILPRKNELIRPAVSNIDMALVIFASAKPDPNFNLLDRFLCMMEYQHVPVTICFNKKDLITPKEQQELKSIYEPAGYRVLFTSTKTGEGIDEIKAISREAGSRTKIAVWSNDPNVDPVGACVGMNGARVNAIVNELRGEKIDIITWDENPAILIQNALSPAKVISVIADADEKSAKVVVPDYQLSLAIGKEGQNARLAARLTGFKIDIKSETQARESGDFMDYENDYEEDDYDDDYDYSDDELAENERLADTEQADVQAEAFDTEADENGAAGTENDAADSGDEQ